MVQLPFGIELLVLADTVAAVLLGKVQGLISLPQNFNRRAQLGAGKANADRDRAHLRKCMPGHSFPEGFRAACAASRRMGA